MTSGGLITGTPTTLGAKTVLLTLTDFDNRADTAQFNWTILPPPVVTSPGNQIGRTGVPLSLQLAATGGQAPMTWSATGLPAGLTLDVTTGLITGTPTTIQTTTTTIIAIAPGTPPRNSAPVSFQWQILVGPPVVVPQTPPALTIGTPVSFTLTATNGQLPLKWAAVDLPDGLTIDSATGTISGTPTAGTRFITTITVTDSANGSTTSQMVFGVAPRDGNDVVITSPDPANPDMSTPVGSSVSFTAVGVGATDAKNNWTAVNLPPGVTIVAKTGVVSGTPNTKGKYQVRLTVTNQQSTGHLMFVWNVT
jgi:hypothetical protein